MRIQKQTFSGWTFKIAQIYYKSIIQSKTVRNFNVSLAEPVSQAPSCFPTNKLSTQILKANKWTVSKSFKTWNPDAYPPFCTVRHDRNSVEYGSCDPLGSCFCSCSCFDSCCLSSFFKFSLLNQNHQWSAKNTTTTKAAASSLSNYNHTQYHIHECKSSPYFYPSRY